MIHYAFGTSIPLSKGRTHELVEDEVAGPSNTQGRLRLLCALILRNGPQVGFSWEVPPRCLVPAPERPRRPRCLPRPRTLTRSPSGRGLWSPDLNSPGRPQGRIVHPWPCRPLRGRSR